MLSPARLALALRGASPQQTLELVRRAEAAGVSRVLISERPGGPDPFSITAALLVKTERIPIGPGLVSALDRHPLLLARQSASCEQLAPGRALLGLGRGSRHYTEDVLHLAHRPATRRMEEAVTVVRELLSGRELSFHSEFWSLDGPRLDPVPTTLIPILLGASGERTLRMAGRLADSALLNGGASPDYVSWARSTVAGAAEAAGRDPAKVEIAAWCLMAVENSGLWTPSLDRLRRQLAGILLEPDSGHSLIVHSGLGEARIERLLLARTKGLASLERLLEEQDLLRELAVLGSPEQCWRRLDAHRLAGADFIVLQPAAMGALHIL
ncbi:MAG: LLM class flavin-dependent oxidoreductase [Candidatus Dormibacteria bacterium]